MPQDIENKIKELETSYENLKKELSEKQKIIENLYELNKLKIDDIKRLHHLLNDYQDKQLFKEDFDYIVTGINLVSGDKKVTIRLNNNSKYDKLESKEEEE